MGRHLEMQFAKQFRKHSSHICFVFAVVAAVAITGIAGPAAAEDNGGTLRLINPEIFLKGIRIKHIVATLDGADFGGCWADRRQPNNVCIRPQPISAGPHVLEILLDPLTSTYFTWVHKFNTAMSGDWTLDLQGVATDGADTSAYFTEAHSAVPVEGCRAALERLAALPSCTLDELSALAPELTKARNACARGIPRAPKDAASAAFSAVVDNHFDLDAARCYTQAEMKELPSRITSYGQPDEYWPLDMGSWRWARGKQNALSANNIPDALKKLQARLPEMTKRFAVVDGIIKAYLSGDGTSVRQAAMSAPFSLGRDAGRSAQLAAADPHRFYSEDYRFRRRQSGD
jgi:hypothetical protein